MANLNSLGHLRNMMRTTFVHARMALDAQQMGNVELSVGARIQANNGDEVIITQTGHTMETLKSGQGIHTFTINLIAFSKDYTFSARMSDELLEYFSNKADIKIIPANEFNTNYVKAHFFPKSQIMYYTDEDDYATNLTLEVRVIDETYQYYP